MAFCFSNKLENKHITSITSDQTIDNTHKSIGLRIAENLKSRGIPKELVVLIIAMLPVVELRGAIPVAYILGLNPVWSYLLSVAGNMIPVIPILLLLAPLYSISKKIPLAKRFFDWFFERTKKKLGKEIEKYEFWALALFVAIPLPVTGAWTGCAGAFLFDIGFKKSFLSILLGVMTAGIVVSILSLLGWIGFIIASVVLGVLLVKVVFSFYKNIRNSKIIPSQGD
jgi:uncharacterized membrane protein